MSALVIPPAFDELSLAEKIDYVQALWDRIMQEPGEVPVPDWHREVIAERLEAHQAGAGASRPWSEVRRDLQARLNEMRR